MSKTIAHAALTAISKPYNAKPGGLMLMGESAFADDGYVPTPDDTSDHPDWVIRNWDNPDEHVSDTFKCIMRALTNCKEPTRERMVEAWRDVGFANYVAEAMPSRKHRPKTRHWRASKAAFRPWINKYRPAHMLVCGYEAYKQLPDDPDIPPHDDEMCAYRLDDGSYVVCRRAKHPGRFRDWRKLRAARDELLRYRVVDGELRRC